MTVIIAYTVVNTGNLNVRILVTVGHARSNHKLVTNVSVIVVTVVVSHLARDLTSGGGRKGWVAMPMLRMGGLCGLFVPLRRSRGRGGTVSVLRRNTSHARIRRIANVATNLVSVGFAIGGNRMFILVNLSNDNGSALVHYLGVLGPPASNAICLRNSGVAGFDGGRLRRLQHAGITVIFRGFKLVDGHGILRGTCCNLRVHNMPLGRHARGTVRVLRVINLRN